MAVSEEERNAFIMECLNGGMSLSVLQKELVSKFDLHMTYMELRMLTSDLQVNWSRQDAAVEAARPKSKPEAATKPQPSAEAAEAPASAEYDEPSENAEELPMEEGGAAPSSGKTTVEVSKLVRPGTQMSGSVNFGSGARGEWYIDNMGRLGFEPGEGSSEPTTQDIQEFQVELRRALRGY